MNPQDQNTPINGQLPPVIPQDEVSSSVGVNAGSAKNSQASEQIPSTSAQAHPSMVGNNNAQTSKSPHAPSIADDNDLIEKEWVNKAKMIIAKTKDNPREQSEELFKYKADYIKKRYNKDIKVSES